MKEPLRIGIVGGGQLGKMLTIAAKKLGFIVTVIDPTEKSPAAQVADYHIQADYTDEKAIKELTKHADVITFEIELANEKTLAELSEQGIPIHPSPKTLAMIQDKLVQKQFLKQHKLPTTKFVGIPTSEVANAKEAIEKAGKLFGYPLMLKAREDAYDGRGNVLIRNTHHIDEALETLKGRTLYVEQHVPFAKELAVMVARRTNGTIAVYPVVETVHVDNICDTVFAPAHISQAVRKDVQTIAKKTMRHLKGAGVFGIEMFLTNNNNVLINEIAPRVHNSGHFTIEACVTSQFEQHIRAIASLPLGSPAMLVKAAVMKNILGTKQGPGFALDIEKALAITNVSLHLYGKHEARPKRKMGHITVVGETLGECLRKANKARRALVI